MVSCSRTPPGHEFLLSRDDSAHTHNGAMTSPTRTLILALAVFIGGSACGGHDRATATIAWLAARGRADWSSCLRIGAALRAECHGDAACEAAVSDDVTFECHVAAYRADRAVPCDGSETHGADLAALARDRCRALHLPPAHVRHCEAEVRSLLEVQCWLGDARLTGAGP